MYVYHKKNKVKSNKLSSFYKVYFFLSLVIIFVTSLIFFNTGIWKNGKEDLLNRIHVNGLNNYLKIFSIANQIIKHSHINLDEINLNFNYEKFLVLEQERKKIISESEKNMRSSDHNFIKIKGNIENNKGNKVNIDLRLKGDRITHFEKNRTSYKIEVDRNNYFYGLKKFSLIKPRARNYIHEWIFHELIGEENLIKLNYNFINLKINGEDNGLYVLEEGFDKILVERHNRRNGPIFSMIEEFSTNINFAQFEIYNKNSWNREENIDLLSIAQKKLQKFFDGSLEAKDVLDLDKWFWYFAVTDLTYTHHGLSPRNVKFYYNPLSGLFEPIGYDGHRTLANFDPNLKNFNHQTAFDRATTCKSICHEDDEVAQFLFKFFYDQYGQIKKENYFLYKKKVSKISDENFLKNFLSSRKNKIQLLNAKIYNDYFLIDNTPYVKYGPGIYYFSTEDLYYRSKKLRSKIKYKQSKIKITENYRKINFVNNNEINNYSIKLTELFCYGLDKFNVYQDQIKLSNLNLNYNFKNPLVVEKKKFKNQDINNCYKAKLTDSILNETFLVNINFINNDLELIKKNKYNFKKFFSIQENILHLINPETIIDEDLYIPEGLKVKIKASEKIFLINNSVIFSESPWEIGSKNSKKAYIGGYKENFGGGIIIKTNNKKSLIVNTKFEYLYGTKNRFLNLNNNYFSIKSSYLGNNKFFSGKGQKLSNDQINKFTQGLNYMGAINFYKSDVKIINSDFSKIQAEDAINIISGNFEIYDTVFDTIASDAVDIDFGKGKFNNLVFNNIGNDALDFSGSNINIKKIIFNNIGDKSISLGENTIAKISDLKGKNIFCGIAAKDGSDVTVKNVSFNNTEIPFASYNKKTFYDPPVLKIDNNFSVKNFKKIYLKDVNSKIIVNRKDIKNVNKHVYKIIYKKDLSLL